jgi:diguanylate cyclase (GGDEF)-like protein
MYKLLVIESEGETRDQRVSLLQENCFEVIVTSTIAKGLALAQQKPPDLILAALDLAGSSNCQLLQAVLAKSELAAIPVIVITQNSDRDYQRQCITLGADDCLVMPFNDDVLMGAIAIRLRKQDALTQRYNTLMRHTAERLNRLSHYDSLTDLPNHHLLQQRLMLAINRAAVGNQRVALLSLSLDRLRQINNTLGFPAGDTLLRAAARRLTGILPPSTAVARLTGNQFAIVLPAPKHREDVAAITEEVIDSLSRDRFRYRAMQSLSPPASALPCFQTIPKTLVPCYAKLMQP